MITSTGPLTLAALGAGALFFAAALIWTHNEGGVRAAYFFSIVFVSLLVALAALGGLARAMGLAIADPRTSVPGCFEGEFDLRDFGRARDLQRELSERVDRERRFLERLELEGERPRAEDRLVPPTERFPIPEGPTVGQVLGCPEASGRSGAGAEAARSGVLFALAAALVWVNAVRVRRLLDEEDRHAR